MLRLMGLVIEAARSKTLRIPEASIRCIRSDIHFSLTIVLSEMQTRSTQTCSKDMLLTRRCPVCNYRSYPDGPIDGTSLRAAPEPIRSPPNSRPFCTSRGFHTAIPGNNYRTSRKHDRHETVLCRPIIRQLNLGMMRVYVRKDGCCICQHGQFLMKSK